MVINYSGAKLLFASSLSLSASTLTVNGISETEFPERNFRNGTSINRIPYFFGLHAGTGLPKARSSRNHIESRKGKYSDASVTTVLGQMQQRLCGGASANSGVVVRNRIYIFLKIKKSTPGGTGSLSRASLPCPSPFSFPIS
jgi:hypothetical protein